MGVQLNPTAVFKFLLLATVSLVALHLLGVMSTYYFGHDHVKGLVPMFNLDGEGNVPAWFAGAIGIELLGSSFWELGSSELSAQYYLFASLEESLEMTGIVIFIYSLLIYISDQQLTLSCIRHSNNRN